MKIEEKIEYKDLYVDSNMPNPNKDSYNHARIETWWIHIRIQRCKHEIFDHGFGYGRFR